MLTLIATMAAQAGSSLDPEELEGLLAGLAAGNRDSLAALYHRTRAAVYGLALSYLKNGHDAEDVTQDTFVRAWDKADQYRPQGKPLGGTQVDKPFQEPLLRLEAYPPPGKAQPFDNQHSPSSPSRLQGKIHRRDDPPHRHRGGGHGLQLQVPSPQPYHHPVHRQADHRVTVF